MSIASSSADKYIVIDSSSEDIKLYKSALSNSLVLLELYDKFSTDYTNYFTLQEQYYECYMNFRKLKRLYHMYKHDNNSPICKNSDNQLEIEDKICSTKRSINNFREKLKNSATQILNKPSGDIKVKTSDVCTWCNLRKYNNITHQDVLNTCSPYCRYTQERKIELPNLYYFDIITFGSGTDGLNKLKELNKYIVTTSHRYSMPENSESKSIIYSIGFCTLKSIAEEVTKYVKSKYPQYLYNMIYMKENKLIKYDGLATAEKIKQNKADIIEQCFNKWGAVIPDGIKNIGNSEIKLLEKNSVYVYFHEMKEKHTDDIFDILINYFHEYLKF